MDIGQDISTNEKWTILYFHCFVMKMENEFVSNKLLLTVFSFTVDNTLLKIIFRFFTIVFSDIEPKLLINTSQLTSVGLPELKNIYYWWNMYHKLLKENYK